MEIEKYLKKLNKNKLAIFLFHGVIKENKNQIRNYTNKHIASSNFEYFIKNLNKKGNKLSYREAINYIKHNKKFPPYSFCITFDDGFKNNLTIAIPILKKYKVPATFYISSELIQNNSMTWIDSIEYCFEYSSINNIKLPGIPKIINLNTNEEKIKTLKHLRKYIKFNPKKVDTKELVKRIFKHSDLKKIITTNNDILDQKLNWNEIKKINNTNLFDIGGHSHEHISLGFLSKKQAEKQIKKSIQLIKKNTGILVDLYSYPEGQESDFSNNTINILKKYNIISSPSAIYGFNEINEDLFYLKRIIVE